MYSLAGSHGAITCHNRHELIHSACEPEASFEINCIATVKRN
jgi:hypothetical protein